MRASARPLRQPGFPQLAGAYLVNELGNWLGEIALAVVVFDLTGSPLATAGLFVAMQFLPALIAPALVARIDHVHARRVLPALYAAEAVAFGVLAVLVGIGDAALPALLALAALDGTLASTARSITRATAAATLRPSGMLREGNAILNVGFTAGAAAGPALGGLVVAGAGSQVALVADAVSFLLVAGLLLTARQLPQPDAGAAGISWGERLRAGVRYVTTRPALRGLLAAQAVAFVFFSLVIPIEVVFVKETLGEGDLGYGLLLSSWGAGMVAGSFLFASLRRVSLPALLVVSTTAIGAAYIGIAVSPTLGVACAASALGGIGNGVQWVALVTAVQELTGPAYQARVISLLEALASAMPGLGFLAGGAIAALLSPRVSYAVAGAGVLVVLGAAILILRTIDWRAVERGAPEDERPAASANGGHHVSPRQPDRLAPETSIWRLP